MKNKLLITLSLLTIATTATAAPKLRITPECEKTVTRLVTEAYGKDDETFGVIGYKIIYVGFLADLVIVRTTDEVEPRDILVSVNSYKKKGEKEVCKVEIKEVVADGSVSEIDDELQLLDQIYQLNILGNTRKSKTCPPFSGVKSIFFCTSIGIGFTLCLWRDALKTPFLH